MSDKNKDLTAAIYSLSGAYYYMDCVADYDYLIPDSKEKIEKIKQSIQLLQKEFNALKESEERKFFI